MIDDLKSPIDWDISLCLLWFTITWVVDRLTMTYIVNEDFILCFLNRSFVESLNTMVLEREFTHTINLIHISHLTHKHGGGNYLGGSDLFSLSYFPTFTLSTLHHSIPPKQLAGLAPHFQF